jgi:hypothetical protein
MSTVGSICANRSMTLRAPKSGEHDDQMAPMLAVASRPMTASGTFGSRAATRSPRRTPRARSPRATRATWWAS